MKTRLNILGWKAEGLRCPDHEVSFQKLDGSLYPNTLIQMPNGTGKTTTLQLLRAAMSGQADNSGWSEDHVREFQKRDRVVDEGRFELYLLHDDRRLTIILEFDFQEGKVSYKTTYADAGGQSVGFHPPRGLQTFFTPDFVEFFVFDGELAEQLLDKQHTDAQRAIESLFQLHLFDSMTSQIHNYWDARVQDSDGGKSERGKSRHSKRVSQLRERIQELRAEKEETERKLTRKQAKLNEDKEEFESYIEKSRELHNELSNARIAEGDARTSLNNLAHEILDDFRDPHALSATFANEMTQLKKSLDRVKLPENTAREFFEELSQEACCVCGRELDEQTRENIRKRAQHYLGANESGLLNEIKSAISNQVGIGNEEQHEAHLDEELEKLQAAVREFQEAQTARERVEAKARQNPEIEEVKQRIESLESQVSELNQRLEKFEDREVPASMPDNEITSIEELERRLYDSKEKLAQVTSTIKLKHKCDLLERIVTRARNKTQAGMSQEICANTNQRISELMPDNTIRVREINDCLVLQGQGGGSAGETLAIAYAFLSTLYNRSDHELPFIVDSPANPLDLRVRNRVAELLPRLTGQFIAFTISSEREGFLAPLREATNDDIQFLTLFRKGSTDLEARTPSLNGAQESEDGICVDGPEFFQAFHLDTEE